MKTMTTDIMMQRVKALKLHGLLAHWDESRDQGWVTQLLQWEEDERSQRSLDGRLKGARIGRFKPLADFDWDWPKKCDREAIEEFMQLTFLKEAVNVILCGPNGAGKSTIAKNIAYQAIIHGHTALFTTAGDMLKDLASLNGAIYSLMLPVSSRSSIGLCIALKLSISKLIHTGSRRRWKKAPRGKLHVKRKKKNLKTKGGRKKNAISKIDRHFA